MKYFATGVQVSRRGFKSCKKTRRGKLHKSERWVGSGTATQTLHSSCSSRGTVVDSPGAADVQVPGLFISFGAKKYSDK